MPYSDRETFIWWSPQALLKVLVESGNIHRRQKNVIIAILQKRQVTHTQGEFQNAYHWLQREQGSECFWKSHPEFNHWIQSSLKVNVSTDFNGHWIKPHVNCPRSDGELVKELRMELRKKTPGLPSLEATVYVDSKRSSRYNSFILKMIFALRQTTISVTLFLLLLI